MIELAKQALDVGLYTNRLDESLVFWGKNVALPLAEMLPVGGGIRQHRHLVGESVLKINHSRHRLPEAQPGGIRAIVLGNREGFPPIEEARRLQDPDGNEVWLPAGMADAPDRLSVLLTVSDLMAHLDFYGRVLGLPRHGERTFGCGVSRIAITEGAAHPDPLQRAPGYRYLTVQVFDVQSTHRDVLARGGREGMAPVKLADVAHISFVRDPDGNWIEISQRKSLTGSLD